MIINGDCLEEMQKMDFNSISAVVTDPPYGLGFMGKDWDDSVPLKEYWDACWRALKPGGFLLAFGGTRTFHRLACAIEDAGFELRDTIMWVYGSGFPKSHNHFGIEGYGTALKPAYEPIIMAMKPCDGTFKENAEKWGQAGINIDGCRVPAQEKFSGISLKKRERWPANLIFDEEGARALDRQSESEFSRFFYCAKASSSERNEGLDHLVDKVGGGLNSTVSGDSRSGHVSLHKNNHPTVKPLKLMKYLIAMVMPPKDGVLLDPFAGSGTTILAAHQLGIKAIGIEKSSEYCEIARARIENYKPKEKEADLFDCVEKNLTAM